MSAYWRIAAYITAACASFLLLMVAMCMMLRPQMFDHPHWGLSYFGSQKITLLPYYLGFAIVIVCLAQITRAIWPLRNQWRPLRLVFLVSTVLAAFTAATSSMQGAFLYWSHIYICLVLLLWVLGAEVWVLSLPGRRWQDWVSLTVLLIGAVLVNLSATWFHGGVLGVYYWGETVLFIGAFACLGSAALRAVER